MKQVKKLWINTTDGDFVWNDVAMSFKTKDEQNVTRYSVEAPYTETNLQSVFECGLSFNTDNTTIYFSVIADMVCKIEF